ncbi:cellulose binding domain-containing protein, partial [[Clostridium] polysaccharolyticum]
MRKWKKRILSVLLILAIMGNVIVPSSIQAETAKEGQAVKQIETEKTYTEDGLNITFQITSQWDGACNTQVTIQNTSKKTRNNWALQFRMAGDIVQIWNGTVYQHENDKYIIKNAGYNEQIKSGQSIQFGYMTKTNAAFALPDSVKILSRQKTAEDKDFQVDFQVTDQWDSGFNGELQVKNHSLNSIEGWTLEFDYEGEIYSFWEADIIAHSQNHYIIENRGYNYKIPAESTLKLGFGGASTDRAPEHFVLKHWTIEEPEPASESEELEKSYLDVIRRNLSMKGLPADPIRLADDYDGDGLDLKQEYDYDTNPFEKDSDEDGIEDGEEVLVYQTDPCDTDTDSDQMSDGTERKTGLNPLLQDTDGDGICDGEEVVTQEVSLDLAYELELAKVGTLPEVTLTGKGDYSHKLWVEPVTENDAILEIDSVVGTAYEFFHEDALAFETGELAFQLSDKVLRQNNPEELAIAWYNEEENSLEPMESKYDAKTKTISAAVEHFSIYMVINTAKFLYYSDWENESELIETGKADIVFVIDTTGSMREPIETIRKSIPAFVKKLKEKKVDARFGLVTFKDIYQDDIDSTKNYGWYTSADAFADRLQALPVGGGGGDGPETPLDGLESAFQMRYRTSVKRYVILVTDADYHDGIVKDTTVTLDAQITKLAQKEITVSVFTKTKLYPVYQNAIQTSGGEIADIQKNFAIEAAPLAVKVGKGASGGCWVRLANHTVVHLKKNPLLNDSSVDSDKDGIPDSIELGITKKMKLYNPYGKKYEYQNVWTFSSNPAKKDTDGDNWNDSEDLNPKRFDILLTKKTKHTLEFNTGRTWNQISCTAYDYWDNAKAVFGIPAKHPIPAKKWKKLVQYYQKNCKQKFTVTELTAIGLFNPEGAKLYMDSSKGSTREKVFRNLAGRASDNYQHKGVLGWEKWKKVSKKKQGSFLKGTVLSEADMNFSGKLYRVCDIYTVLNSIAAAGAVIIAIVATVKATPVVLANLKGIAYYCEAYGIKEGLDMYSCMGLRGVPESIVSIIQMDLQDG